MRTITSSGAENISIGELSRHSGVNIETIRYYERVEMLDPPPRTAGGLRLGGPDKASCREVREIAARHLEDIRAKLSDLKKLERLLSKTVARCSGKTAPDCPVLDILDIQRAG